MKSSINDTRSQQEEMELAVKEMRQPICVACGHLLHTVQEHQNENIEWTWNPETRIYKKGEDGDSEGPFHACSECPDGCQVQDYAFTGNALIDY